MKNQFLIIAAFILLISILLSQTDLVALSDWMAASVAPIAATIKGIVLTTIPFGASNVPIVLILLICAASYFTIYFKWINFTKFKLAIQIVRGHHQPNKEPTTTDNLKTIQADHIEGEVTHFQALTSAISATVGLGNIAGVAIAISIGGPGATLWMIIAGIMGMASKFTECTLSVRYREVVPPKEQHTDQRSKTAGGPMYYLSKGLSERGWPTIGKAFGIFYAVMCVGGSLGGGNMFQANQATSLFLETFQVESTAAGILFGLTLSMLVALVIIGGIQRIGKITERIVPAMCGLYLLSALLIIGLNITLVPKAIGQILLGAFSPDAALGGIIGVLVVGFQRAAFSNEAGVGSAAIAHSAARTAYPASEGIVALLEPFIDTVVVCTVTALVIVLYNMNGHFDYGNVVSDMVLIEGNRVGGAALTALAFEEVLPGFSYVLSISVLLFAFSTMLAWSYYGMTSWQYLFGRGRLSTLIYQLLFCFFVILGSVCSLTAVLDFSDAMVFAMVFPNIIGLVLLAPIVKEELDRFLATIN